MATVKNFYFDNKEGMMLVDNNTGHFFQAFEISCNYDNYLEEVKILDFVTDDEQAQKFTNVRFAVEPDFETLDNYEVVERYNEHYQEYTDLLN